MPFDEQLARRRIKNLEQKAKDADDDVLMFGILMLSIPGLFLFGAIIHAFVKAVAP